MIDENLKQKSLRDLEKFAIDSDREFDSVELKKKSGCGEL